MSSEVPQSQEFFQLVDRAGRYVRRHALVVGAALVLMMTVAWLASAVAVDLLVSLTTAWRVVFAAGFWLLLSGASAALLIWPALRRVKLETVALRIEAAIGGMHNRLLTVLDLHRAGGHGASRPDPEMVARLLRQTRSKLSGFRVQQIVDPAPLLRSLWGLVAVMGVTAVLAIVCWDRAPTAFARIMRPTADIPPVTWLRIAAPGDLQVAHGDPLTIEVEITRGEAAELSLDLQQPDGSWVVYPMRATDEGRFAYTLNGITADYRYKISGGGTWTSVYQIHVVPRPIVEDVAAAIRLPRYMRRDEPIPVPADASRIEAPLDSTILVAATVSGDVAAGEILVFKRIATTSEEEQEEERVWFEDDLPADAEAEVPWRWTTARVYTGLKAFTFGRTHQPFGFRTHLNPLQLPADAFFYIYVWLDPLDGPQQMTIRLEFDNGSQAFIWGDPPAGKQKGAAQKGALHVGPLPVAARWVRLEVPANRLGAIGDGIKLRGLSLASEQGQIFFDRPGVLVRKSGRIETVKHEQVAKLPMTREETSEPHSAQRWLGELPVTGSGLFTVRFHSSLQQTSADREPLEIVATVDQPPSLIVEKPARDLVLPEPQPLPVSGRALDDWGIAAVGVQIGPTASTLGPPRWNEGGEQGTTSREILTAIDPQAEHLSPGESLVYRLVARDCKGQIAESATYKLSIATPDKAADPDTAKPPESLDKLAEALSKTGESPTKEDAAAEFRASLPKELREAVDAEGQFRRPDGSEMKADEVRKLVEDSQAQLTDQQKKQLAELTADLKQRQQEAQKLADMLNQSAQEAAHNPLAPQQEAELLRTLANQAGEMARQLDPSTASQGKPAALERELKARPQADRQPQALAALQEQVRRIDAARKQMATNPELAQQMLDAQATELQVAAAKEQLQELAENMKAREKQLQALEQQEGELGQQTKKAEAAQLDSISKQQAGLDKKAVAAVDELRKILGSKQPDGDHTPPAPWKPPGEKSEPNSSKDTPGQDAPKTSPPAGGDATKTSPDAKSPDTAENRWDKPAAPPDQAGPQSQDGDRPQDGQTPAGAPADSKSGDNAKSSQQPGETPREQLTAHQAQMQQALAGNAEQAKKAAARAEELANQLGQPKASQPSTAQSAEGQPHSGKPQGGQQENGQQQNGQKTPGQQQPGQQQQPAADGQPAAAGQQAGQPPGMQQAAPANQSAAEMQRATQALKQQLASPEVQQALAMAERSGEQSSSAQPASAKSSAASGDATKTVNVRPGQALQRAAAPLGTDPRDRAQLYKLPPRVREPLLEGMQEKGPEGYQPLIDAYFRELSKEIK